jgi:hypothetical protein
VSSQVDIEISEEHTASFKVHRTVCLHNLEISSTVKKDAVSGQEVAKYESGNNTQEATHLHQGHRTEKFRYFAY